MPHPSDDYITYAGDCIGMANETRFDDLRREWFRLAQQWIAIMPHRPRPGGEELATVKNRYFGLRPFFLNRLK